jgi:CBS domain-containing protein
MSRDVAWCEPSSTLQGIATLMVEHRCGEIPVCDDARRPIGVVTDRDIVCRIIAPGLDASKATAADCMTDAVITATPEMSIGECARVMEEFQVRRLPVVDQHGVCCGMVAQADLATKAPGELAGELVSKVSQPTETASAVRA